MTASSHLAIDLGASSGRVVLATVDEGRLDLEEVARFDNVPVRLPDGLHWDLTRLYGDVLAGLRAASRLLDARGAGAPATIGVDSWAIDYGLVDADGALLAEPHHYRDERSARGVARVHARMDHAELYPINGLQFLPFNTIYQLAAAAESPLLSIAEHLLLVPDLIAWLLTGTVGAEATNASTTGLVDVSTGRWSEELIALTGVPATLLPELVAPGTAVEADLRAEVREETGLTAATRLVTVGSHDTASAVVGVPATGESWAYVSCGTWALVGVELERPVVTDASRLANFTNEGGVDGTVRFLRNVMGLWLLQESQRVWERAGLPADLPTLLSVASDVPDGGPIVDVDDPAFLPPGDMPARIVEACRRSGERPPRDQAQVVRCIVDSLAHAFARTIDEAEALTGRPIRTVHLVGGGARNQLLAQLTADACGREVLAGPVEATALGNVLVQARTSGSLSGDLASLRAATARTVAPRRHVPRPRRG